MPAGRRGEMLAGTTILDAARQLGIEIESICGGKLTCGKCKIRLEEGRFEKHNIASDAGNLSPATTTEQELLASIGASDCRLACDARLYGDALIFIPEESRGRKQIIRKSATERTIAVQPAIRQYYVVVEKAALGEHRGDWKRLAAAIEEQWGVDGLVIDLPALRKLQSALRQGRRKATVILWNDQQVIDVSPGYQEGAYGLAVDIGSTTVAGYLCDLRTGELLATESTMNPQVAYGEDLMSRISYAMMNADGLSKMHEAIIDALNKLAARIARSAGIRARDIHEAVLVGNTTMIHIALGIDPVELGGAPFALATRDAVDYKARLLKLRLHPGANVHILPAQAGHVGADNVAALIAETPYRQDEITLMVDVGTNAEIVLGNRERLFSASSPTGPAFEGAQIKFGMRAALGAIERVRIDPITKEPRFRLIGEERWSNDWQLTDDAPQIERPAQLAAGICGSGIIEAVAELYLAGIIRADGRFDPEISHERISWQGVKGQYLLATAEETSSGEPIAITQDDVRNIQLGKAALYAGTKLLMNHAGISTVDRILLAGAFGSYIDPKYAMILGLIPDCALDKVTAVGNAAGDGARIALLNKEKRQEAQKIAHWTRYIETAVDASFQEEFVAAIHLPHANDSFPHLADLLPKQQPKRRRKRRRVAI